MIAGSERRKPVRLVRFWIPTRLSIPANRASSPVSTDIRLQVRSCCASTSSAALMTASKLASANVAMAEPGLSLQSSEGWRTSIPAGSVRSSPPPPDR